MPALTLLGTLVGLDGQRRWFVALEQGSAEVVRGLELPGGFVVESVDERVIAVRHSAIDLRAEIALAAPTASAP